MASWSAWSPCPIASSITCSANNTIKTADAHYVDTDLHNSWLRPGSESKDLGLGRHVDQVGAAIKGHVTVKPGFVELAVLGAGGADAHRHLVFDLIGQILVDAVAGAGFLVAVPILHRPVNAAADGKTAHRP